MTAQLYNLAAFRARSAPALPSAFDLTITLHQIGFAAAVEYWRFWGWL